METFITILGIIFCVLLIYYFGGIGVIVEDYLNNKKYTEADLWRVCRHLTSEERQLYQKIYDIIKNTDVSDWVITIPCSMNDPIIYDIDKKIRLIINYNGFKYESERIVIYTKNKQAVNNIILLDPKLCVSMEAQDFLVHFAMMKRDRWISESHEKERIESNKLYENAVKEALKHI